MNEFSAADIRLVGSELSHEGRLEVKVAGIWGTVCDDQFDDVDAGVACSMLGFGYESKRKSCWLAVTRRYMVFVANSISLECAAL